MSKLTTHALDTYSGKPAKGMKVDVYFISEKRENFPKNILFFRENQKSRGQIRYMNKKNIFIEQVFILFFYIYKKFLKKIEEKIIFIQIIKKIIKNFLIKKIYVRKKIYVTKKISKNNNLKIENRIKKKFSKEIKIIEKEYNINLKKYNYY